MAKTLREEVFEMAGKIVMGKRQSDYGAPKDNFERIARFWQAYFANTGRGHVTITAGDVSPMMRLLKEARLCESPAHIDSHVDLIGYALTGAEVAQAMADAAGSEQLSFNELLGDLQFQKAPEKPEYTYTQKSPLPGR